MANQQSEIGCWIKIRKCKDQSGKNKKTKWNCVKSVMTELIHISKKIVLKKNQVLFLFSFVWESRVCAHMRLEIRKKKMGRTPSRNILTIINYIFEVRERRWMLPVSSMCTIHMLKILFPKADRHPSSFIFSISIPRCLWLPRQKKKKKKNK